MTYLMVLLHLDQWLLDAIDKRRNLRQVSFLYRGISFLGDQGETAWRCHNMWGT